MLLYFKRNRIVAGYNFGEGFGNIPDDRTDLIAELISSGDAREATAEEVAAYVAGRSKSGGYSAPSFRAGELSTDGSDETLTVEFDSPMPGEYVVFLYWNSSLLSELVFDKTPAGFRVQLQGRVVGPATIRYYVCKA